ncbi:MAG: hypothetical protein II155_06730, partial [Clostridia bacterium]|nr:hypothetical protein [Clostridia bacterium]
KSCNGHKPFESSNLSSSAKNNWVPFGTQLFLPSFGRYSKTVSARKGPQCGAFSELPIRAAGSVPYGTRDIPSRSDIIY